MFRIELSTPVKDKLTGFKGIVVCQSRYLTGCNRYAVQSTKLKDNKPQDWEHFDEDMLIVTGKPHSFTRKQNGGPVRHEAPQR